MTKRMLIDATHAEETRVVVLDGTRLEDFDVETSTKRQLKGNIYLAKVVRVEPSLQAAFVEYGGNRHGFLAFSEIHPDYYQIPVADRQRLLEMQAEEARREEEEEDLELALSQSTGDRGSNTEAMDEAPFAPVVPVEPPPLIPAGEDWAVASTPRLLAGTPAVPAPPDQTDVPAGHDSHEAPRIRQVEAWARPETPSAIAAAPVWAEVDTGDDRIKTAQPLAIAVERIVGGDLDVDESDTDDGNGDVIETLPPPETIGGGDPESHDDQRERRLPPRFLRNYKIQEVIRRRQILLVQVVKEERGTKGAALTTYLSLAGRFGVLMPNSPRGGGISRKITSPTDRRRLKEVMAELDIPRGMGIIVRTAGANRPKPEIKRDCEYLLRLWDDIREHTLKSVAPALIYEEASLIKRAIRDVYSRDIDEILVDGEDGWRAAHDFMRMLMPSHAKKVQLWRDNGSLAGQPLFSRHQVEAQLDGMLMPTVQLRSGGYLVINQAEALVAIDVNSGRSTRERNIEETALRTNLEAADEIARQLRLRDLAGLIVIDFIDMESKRHNAMVERRIKEALKNDRARIQVGHISHFGLLEMSRQRLRPSLAETSFIACPHCGGTGHVRSTENAAIHVLRGIEDEGGKRRSAEIVVYVATPIALYLLNHKRERLREIENRYVMRVVIAADDNQIAPQFRIERVRTRSPDEMPVVVTAERSMAPPLIGDVEEEDEEDEAEVEAEAEAVVSDDDDDESEEDTQDQQGAEAAAGGGDEAERRRKRRRRRRRGGKRDEQSTEAGSEVASPTGDESIQAGETVDEATVPDLVSAPDTVSAPDHMPEEALSQDAAPAETVESSESGAGTDDDLRNRRRGRRGGRRRRRDNEGELSPFAVPGADQPELQPVYAGPTPADPFGGRVFDIFDVMDQVERAAEAQPIPPVSKAAEIARHHTAEPVEAPAASAPSPAVPSEFEAVEASASADQEIVDAPPPEPQEPAQQAEPEPVFIEAPAVPEPPIALTEPAPLAAEPAPSDEHTDEVVTLVETAEPPSPAIKPILVGVDGEAPQERKRGWWRR